MIGLGSLFFCLLQKTPKGFFFPLHAWKAYGQRKNQLSRNLCQPKSLSTTLFTIGAIIADTEGHPFSPLSRKISTHTSSRCHVSIPQHHPQRPILSLRSWIEPPCLHLLRTLFQCLKLQLANSFLYFSVFGGFDY